MKKNQQKLLKFTKFLFLFFGIAFIVFQFQNINLNFVDALQLRFFAFSTILLFIGISLFSLYWGFLLQNLDPNTLLSQSMKNYFQGQLGKYIPGSIWSITGRIGLAVESGLPIKEVTKITTKHLYHLWLNCLILGLILYSEKIMLLGIFICFIGFYSFYFKKPYFIYFTGWLFIGLSYLILIINLETTSQINNLKIMSSAILSWLGGFLFIPSPSGIGVREYLFSFIYSDVNLYDKLFIVATLSRIASLISDFFGFIFYSLYFQKSEKTK